MQLDPKQQNDLLNALETLKSFIEHCDVKKTCSDCIFYREHDTNCTKFKQSIPDHIIKVGCKEWEYDTIPF